MARYGALQLGLVWQRLSGFIDEAAQVFLRTSFSSVVRDNWDMALGLMDSQGRQIVQSAKSVPSFIGTMPRTLKAMLERFLRRTQVGLKKRNHIRVVLTTDPDAADRDGEAFFIGIASLD